MTTSSTPEEIRVCIDIGSVKHYVAYGLSDGTPIGEFELEHTSKGIDLFFERLDSLERTYKLPIAVAMEGYNGYARPIDQLVLAKGYKLYSVNNLKLARFKEIFAAPATTDQIDAWKIFELFQMRDTLDMARNILQEVKIAPEENAKLKRLSRRRREVVREKVRLCNRLEGDLLAVCPGLSELTGQVDNRWFLNFVTTRDDLRQLAGLQHKSLLKIKGVGKLYAQLIRTWQKNPTFSPEVGYMSEMIVRDARRALALLSEIAALDAAIKLLVDKSEIATHLLSITGCGPVSASELAGEIGTLTRFKGEAGLAVYMGVAPLTCSSGKTQKARTVKHVNRRAKGAIHTLAWNHIRQNPESRKYYDKKIKEGKKHNQAIRAFARHLVRVIWSMLRDGRDYEIRTCSGDTVCPALPEHQEDSERMVG